MQNAFDPSHPSGSETPSPPAEAAWKSWLITAALVFAGVTLGGMAAGLLVPKPEQPLVVARSERPVAAKPAPAGPASTSAEKPSTPGSLEPPPASKTEPAKNITPERPPAAPSHPSAPAKPTQPLPQPAPNPSPRPATAPIPSAVEPKPAQPSAPAPAQPVEKEKPAEDPAKRAAYSRAVADARRAIWQRDMTAARKFVNTAHANLQNQTDQTELERLELVLDNLNQFWNGLRNAVAKLQVGDELELKDNRVAVIEASRDELMIQIYGRQERYRIEAMPIALLTALVNKSFAQTPDSKVIVATFLAMDKEGDRGRARLLWEDAAKRGQSLGRDLLPELSIPLPDVGGGTGGKVHNLGGGR